MTNDKITPSLESYAGYLEAISRSKCVDVAEIPKIVSEMKSNVCIFLNHILFHFLFLFLLNLTLST